MSTLIVLGLIWLVASFILGLVVGRILHGTNLPDSSPCDCPLCTPKTPRIMGHFDDHGVTIDHIDLTEFDPPAPNTMLEAADPLYRNTENTDAEGRMILNPRNHHHNAHEPTYDCRKCGVAKPITWMREDGICMDCHFPTKES